MKRALITGITGQDGSYLAELLLEKGYEVHGVVRMSSTNTLERLKKVESNERCILHEGDLLDGSSLKRIMKKVMPHEIYNLGAMSHVKVSFEVPEAACNINALGTLRLLEAMRQICPSARFYQASTSELFGAVKETPQSETTPFNPRSPYAISKQFAYYSVVNYREAYNLYACNGILFNHESPRRGEQFVTRKITLGIAKIKLGLQKELILGNLNAKRDWGFARDFVEGMWLMLQQDAPDDFVLATGMTTTVRNFVELGFKNAGITIAWEGNDVDEVGRDATTGEVLVRVSPEFFRPTEVELLIGDCSKAEKLLGWKASTSLDELAKMMVDADLQLLSHKAHAIV